MGYVSGNLMPGESIIARAWLHWGIFLRAAVWTALGFAVLCVGSCFEEVLIAWPCYLVAGVVLIGAVAKWIGALLRWVSSEYALTNKRVLVKVGIVRRHSLELLLSKIEAIGVDQSIVGRALGYGTLVITGTGGSTHAYGGIASPLRFRRAVQEQIGKSCGEVGGGGS